jgi:hypothetical protein
MAQFSDVGSQSRLITGWAFDVPFPLSPAIPDEIAQTKRAARAAGAAA